jgi:RNA polymerase sigma factor for flagellar operon FliA
MKSAGSRIQRSQEERDRLVEKYLPLVRYVVARLPVTMPAMLDRDDFYGVGVMGLMHAAATYDPTRGASFKTFAYTAIRGAILDEIRKHDPVPRNRRDRLRQIDQASKDLYATLQREPTMLELAESMQCTVEELEEDFQALHTARTLSLDDTGGGSEEDSSSLASALADESITDPGEGASARERIDLLTKAIAELPETERHVVVLYYHERLFLKEIGQVLNVTESRVSQILTRATERLRLKLGAEAPV